MDRVAKRVERLSHDGFLPLEQEAGYWRALLCCGAVMMWLAVVVGLARAECPPDPESAVWRSADTIDEAYIRLDERMFDMAASGLQKLLPCVRTPLTVEEVARLHRTMGLVAFVGGQTQASRKSWAAARALEPGWVLPEGRFPEGHPLRAIFDTALIDEAAVARERLEPMAWRVDGAEADSAPLNRAFVLQALGEQGEVRYTGYLWSVVDVPVSVVEPTGVRGVQMQVELSGVASAVFARQAATGSDAPLRNQQGRALAGGTAVHVRWLPDPRYGLDLSATGLMGGDAVRGGGFVTEAVARGLVGAAFDVGYASRLRVAARPGIAVDEVRAWGLDAEDATVFVVPSLVLGAEASWVRQPVIAMVGIDGLLASGYLPYQIRPEASIGWLFASSFAVEARLAYHHRRLSVTTSLDEPIGERRDQEVRATLGVGVWR